jgi:hypothetical protein
MPIKKTLFIALGLICTMLSGLSQNQPLHDSFKVNQINEFNISLRKEIYLQFGKINLGKSNIKKICSFVIQKQINQKGYFILKSEITPGNIDSTFKIAFQNAMNKFSKNDLDSLFSSPTLIPLIILYKPDKKKKLVETFSVDELYKMFDSNMKFIGVNLIWPPLFYLKPFKTSYGKFNSYFGK